MLIRKVLFFFTVHAMSMGLPKRSFALHTSSYTMSDYLEALTEYDLGIKHVLSQHTNKSLKQYTITDSFLFVLVI